MNLEDKINRLNKELLKIKKGLKDWEHNFYKKYQKKPTLDDIKARPKVERVYKDYNVKKRQLKTMNNSQTINSQSQPLTYYDTFSQPLERDPFYTSSSQENTYMDSPKSTYSPSSSSMTLSPTHQRQRRSSQASIEYIRSPSHKLSRIKYIDHQQQLPSTMNPFHHILEEGENEKELSSLSTIDKQSYKRKLIFDEEQVENDENEKRQKIKERKSKDLSISTHHSKKLTEDASFWLSPSSATTTTSSTSPSSLPLTLESPLLLKKENEKDNNDTCNNNEKGNKKIDTFFSSTSISTNASSSSNTQNNNNNNNKSNSLFSSNTNQPSKKKKKRKNAALEQKIFGHLIWKPRDTQTNETKVMILDNNNNDTVIPDTNSKDGKENEFMSSSSSSSSTSTSPQSTTNTTIDHHHPTSLLNHSSSSIISITNNMNNKENNHYNDEKMNTMNDDNDNDVDDINHTATSTLTLDNLIITERKLDPFRNYDPSLFAWDDPDFIVTPGFFSSVRARSTIMAPMMKDDPSRYERVLNALKNNTLGEVVRKQEDEDEDLDEDLKRFIHEHSITTTNTTNTSFA
ncbi:unnamed protein product [Cunninghamella blakesleeana]